MRRNVQGLFLEKNVLFLAGLEPATFRVLGGRDNHYTTETPDDIRAANMGSIQFSSSTNLMVTDHIGTVKRMGNDKKSM